MNTAVINIKTDPVVKKKAQLIAEEFGVSLSSLITALLKHVIRTKTITLSVSKEEPTEYLLQALKESKEDIKAGRVSPGFDNAKDASAWLDDPNARYQNGDKV